MTPTNTRNHRVASYQDIQGKMFAAAVAYWLQEKKPPDEIRRILSTPHQLSEETSALINGYANTCGVRPDALLAKYNEAPLQYSADIRLVVAKDPMTACKMVSGLSASASSLGKKFGFEYFHGGVVPMENVRVSPAASKRETVIVFESGLRHLRHRYSCSRE